MSWSSAESQLVPLFSQFCRKHNISSESVVFEIPRQMEFGDLSSNLAMSAARSMQKQPRLIAEMILKELKFPNSLIEKIEIAGPGFINLYYSSKYLYDMLNSLVEDPGKFAAVEEKQADSWIFEFVSANPTGPLNIVSARAASVGSTLVNIFRRRGHNSWAEFYVNDGGRQVSLLGASIIARRAQIEHPERAIDFPDEGYHGDYVIEIADKLQEQNPKIDKSEDEQVGKWAAGLILSEQMSTLAKFRVVYDRWFKESELYESEKTDEVINELSGGDAVYVKENATYFRASDYGDNNDRVLRTSDSRLTYIVPDIAYHLDKKSRGFQTACTILGPDHHGQTISMKAALKALAVEDGFYHPLIIQQVNLKRDGVEVKMSKRAGIGINLEELIDEVGVDAARFFFLLRKTSSHLDFDIELAKKNSNDNPVFYVQYAHARIKSILRQPDIGKYSTGVDLHRLREPEEIALLRTIAKFPATLDSIVRSVDPQLLTTYLTELAKAFHKFYTEHRVITDDVKTTAARLHLCKGVALLLKEGLALMGVEAPERM